MSASQMNSHPHHLLHHHQQTTKPNKLLNVSTIKLLILKKGEYDIWAMKMEYYLAHTDYPIWEVIQNGNGSVSITQIPRTMIKVLPPETAEEIQQFEGFSVSNTEGLHKGYDRFQSLLSQLEIHGAGVDSLSFDDLYNNLRVFESDIKGSTASSSSPQNVAFVSENTSSTNDVSTAYSVPNLSGQNSKMDLKWQCGHDPMRRKKFYKKTAWKLHLKQKYLRKDAHGILETKDGAENWQKEDSKALVIIDGEGVDWTNHSEDEDYALMACNSSDSDTETQSSESESQTSEFDTCESNISTKPSELVSEPVVNESNIECQPKVWSDAPIIEEYESDSEDEYVSTPRKEQETPSFANQQWLPCCFWDGLVKVYSIGKGKIRTGTEDTIDALDSEKEDESAQDCFVLPIWPSYSSKITPALKTDDKTEERFQVYSKVPTLLSVVKSIFRRLISWQCKKSALWILILQKQNLIAACKAVVGGFVDSNQLGLIEVRESLRRVTYGNYALLIPTLFILWLDKVSTDSANLVPLGKVCTAIETLKTNTAKGTNSLRNLSQIHSSLQALISLLTTITLSTTMAVLDSCPKHNMVAYLEKSEGNAEFHEIIDFLKRSSIHHALTVMSPCLLYVDKTTEDAGVISESEVPIEQQNDSSPRPSPSTIIPDSISEASSGNIGDQAKEIQHLKAQIKKLKKQAKPGRKFAKGESSVQGNPLFDEIPEDTVDHMETENAQDVGRTREIVDEEKEIDENILSTEDVLSTDKEKVSTDKEKVSTDRPIVVLSESKVNDETIAKVLLNMSQAKAVSREKEKGVELKDIEETDRPRPTSTRSLLTLKPLPKIDPKDKKIQEEWEGEEERNRIAEEKATNEALMRNFDDIKARIEADRLLAEKLVRSEAIRNRPPIKNQLRNQMMTYLRHVGNFKHSELKTKKFEEIQALYKKIKRSDEDFISIGSAKDEDCSKDDKAEHLEEINQNVVIRSNGQKRYFSTLMRVLSIFDREDLNVVYQLVMDRYQDEIPEGFDRVLWEIDGVHTLVTETGLVIHMLVEKKYPLRKKVLVQMLKLKLESEEDSTMALELIRFIKKLLAELEPEDFDGDEEDL
ncbi:hypothetical protein Tco_0748129 [Tanacetum coccineum]|uniref:Uncharacterized protein n=1 Tax=Tanacetum coccineum TaxID=301880 RepID=A0ABQ4YXR1_9ASTR